ncbi:hypothetical protein K438DRAFT_1774275 [Mycena galopus ATCC 62051]|nr:hypothetical protein K438DRAFT_1774275 [Mycena galopus ATCC 62051]
MNATDGIDIVHGSVSAVYPLRRGRGKRETPAERGPQAKKFPGRAKRTVRVPNSPIIRGNGTHRLPGTPIYPPSKIGLGSMWMVVKKKSAGACAGEERAGKSDCPLQKRKRKAIKKNHLIMIPIPRQHPRIRGENGGGSACAWRTGYQHANDEISARKRNRAAREGKQSGGGRAGGKARGTVRAACEHRSSLRSKFGGPCPRRSFFRPDLTLEIPEVSEPTERHRELADIKLRLVHGSSSSQIPGFFRTLLWWSFPGAGAGQSVVEVIIEIRVGCLVLLARRVCGGRRGESRFEQWLGDEKLRPYDKTADVH